MELTVCELAAVVLRGWRGFCSDLFGVYKAIEDNGLDIGEIMNN